MKPAPTKNWRFWRSRATTRRWSICLNQYKNFVRSKARSYFLIGADHEDIVQEGMIGLYKAIRDFKPEKLSSFRAFAELCITRQIITAIKTATRQKHIPLNSYVSLNKPIYDDGVRPHAAGRNHRGPRRQSRGHADKSGRRWPRLRSKHRADAFVARTRGAVGLSGRQELSGNRAGARTGTSKSIDNALQRVKRKLEKFLAENGGE